MKANPGGNLDPDCVYGRENLIKILWDEVPWMLESIARNNGLTTAAEVETGARTMNTPDAPFIRRFLTHHTPPEWLNDLLDQPPTEISKILTQRLTVRFNSRKLVILAENLQRLFDGIGKDGQHQLRALLQEHPFACLITTSPTLFSAVTDRREAFFGFFQQIPLQPLPDTTVPRPTRQSIPATRG